MAETEVARLRQELEEARTRAEEASTRAEEAEKREADERRKNQKTTLYEYLSNCHFNLYKKLSLAPLALSSTGATKVIGKYYPMWLRPWNDFKNILQPQHFEAIRQICGEERRFRQESTTRDNGETISRTQAGNEDDIGYFEKLAVENPVRDILQPLWDNQELCQEYRCTELSFTNTRRDIAESSDDQGPSKRAKVARINPDGFGVRTDPDGEKSHAFVFDYKAAHKIAVGSVEKAVGKETLFTEVLTRVNSTKITNNDEKRRQEQAEELIAKALTQVFDYMVRHGVAYGYVAAGQSLLLLHVDRSDLQSLYCHACLPDEDVGDPAGEGWVNNKLAYTAIAQLASFCLLTLLSDPVKGISLDEAWCKAEATLKTWPELYDAGSLSDENLDPSPVSASQSTDANSATGRRIGLRPRPLRKTTDIATWDGSADEYDDAGLGGPLDIWTRISSRELNNGPPSGSLGKQESEILSRIPTRPYCTQRCLLGLKRGGVLDDSCTNVHLHRTAGGGSHHPITASEFTELVNKQLRQSPYLNCDSLDRRGKMGSSGVLFKLELAPYGYTLVAKGAWSDLPTVLEHETRIYARLDRLQGDVVPVHLGMVSLDWGHAIAGGIRVCHMMLLSWAGERAVDSEVPDLEAEKGRCLKAVWAEGVNHRDERDDNLLWNAERARVMLVDFDLATLHPVPLNKPLVEVAGNKRKGKEVKRTSI
jgi:hypothetical protein